MERLGAGLFRRIFTRHDPHEKRDDGRTSNASSAAEASSGGVRGIGYRRAWASLVGAFREERRKRLLRSALFTLGLFGIGLLYRLPFILNSAGPSLNSDVAVVGLQAKHMLDGEFSLFLWGTDYQSSFDALVLAPLFLLFGATPTVAMLGPLLGFLLIVGLAFGVLRRMLSDWQAACCTLFLIFVPPSASQYTLFAPRIWSVTAVFLSVWLIERSSEQRRPWLHLALGGFALMMSTFLDMYTLQWLPAVLVFALLCSLDQRGTWLAIARRGVAALGGAILAAALISLLRGERGRSQVTTIDFTRFERNYKLLHDGVWSWLFNFKGEISPGGDPDIYQAALLGRGLQIAGVLVLVTMLLASTVAFFARRLPWKLRRTAALAAMTAGASIAGFLVSTSPMDLASARYLTPLLWMAPFAAAVPAYVLQSNWRLIGLGWPYIALAVSSSCAIVPLKNGLPAISLEGMAASEYALRDWLRSQHVEQAMAGYWDSYRLAFLFDEQPQVVPIDPRSDRHKESRREFAPGERATYIFRSSGPAESDRNDMRRKHASYATSREYMVGDYVAVLWVPQQVAAR